MHKVALALAYLACACHARPLATPVTLKQPAADEQLDASDPAKSLAGVLSAFNPTRPMTLPKKSSLNRKGPSTQIATANRNMGRRGMSSRMIPLEERTDFTTVVALASVLSLISGTINVLTFLDMGIPTTHHTGSATHIGRCIGKGSEIFGGLEGGVAPKLTALMAGYAAGAGTGGYIAPDGEAVFKGKPSPALLFVGVVVAYAALLRYQTGGSIVLSLVLMAYSQGLQNAITTRCSSCPVRTTHMTGALTDMGAGLGAWLKAFVKGGTPPSLRKPILFGASIVSYVLGGVFGRLLFHSYGILGSLVPALMVFTIGTGVRLGLEVGSSGGDRFPPVDAGPPPQPPQPPQPPPFSSPADKPLFS